MVQLELDREIWFALPVFTLGAAASLGLIDPTLAGIDFNQALFATGGFSITIARLLSIVALGVVVTNRGGGLTDLTSGWTLVEAWVVYVTLGLVLAPPFLPALQSTLIETPWSILAFLVQTMGITLVSFLN